ncbi:uncharacterized protein Z518_07484 [Rhinocladiella mackenziei CBS 650.93]|uniref:Rab-GAP TBC domain-containing protein n=1 Tax=Rhinocladiella mackenziei CBS 650.93 TaxID=1442369 RepID=A0A0D2IL50_9EURO|nr:uncharacterized protein Z518_07484 [Rhinocladiella mackenziei CBS 650.93]KIX03931.1 hypothetical protein Z518_07484 [Rhinocladiella mackenziei CBS 650.93]
MAQKKSQRQEMVQVDRSERPSSPFWRGRSSTPCQASGKPTKVIGASYSHADMLKFDSLSLGSNSRPRTPPTSSARPPQTPPLDRQSFQSPERKPYPGYTSSALGESWDVLGGGDLEDDDDDFVYEDDEDEFGLPSIASMRRKHSMKTKTIKSQQVTYPSIAQTTLTPALAPSPLPPRARSSSFDIAEERNPLSYPSAKKGDGKILRPQYKEILKDPANSLHLISHPVLPPNATPKEAEAHSTRISRINKFKRILQTSSVSLPDLRAAAWSGVPEEVRAITWQLLLGHLPTNSERRVATLERKRKEYLDAVRQAFSSGTTASHNGSNTGLANLASQSPANTGRGRGLDEAIWHQISIDVPRTNPHIPLYAFEATQRSLERILYVWAIRHPASGYVQGINDLATPFWQVFLGTYITDLNIESGMDPGQLPRAVIDAVEADTFWCLTKLLDGIQDNYIVAQPGIHRQVASLRDLTTRIDAGLAQHFEDEHVEYMQFSFRWMNCLLMRELSIRNVIRMWDTYMAEENGFSQFHLYVCAAFLVKWSEQLMKMNFQEILMFLQALPTREWTEKDIELLLSEAFIWQSLFRGSRAHLRTSNSTVPMGSLGPSN